MKLRYTPEAIRDIQEIKRYIRSILKNPAAAKRIGKVILDTCAILKQFPQSGESAEEKLGVQVVLEIISVFLPVHKGNGVKYNVTMEMLMV